MSEDESNEIIVGALKRKRDVGRDFHLADSAIKDIGDKLDALGSKLRSLRSASDPRDLLDYLRKAAVGTERIETLVKDRYRFFNELQEAKAHLARLGFPGS
jgi:hypothetical protein